jgi:hypothetical protein
MEELAGRQFQDSEALDLVVVSANDMAELLETLHELEEKTRA